MGEQLIRPYEISVWEEALAQDGKRIIEKKLAVIGSDTMTGLNKVYNPVFNKKSNGEKTLSFSLKYKYFDPYNESLDLVNPFVDLLTNERKVKLHYEGEWYEFIVKDHTESSEEYSWDYTCTDAFVLELSKNGYNLTFDSELNNNQGTAKDLAKKTLINTDWRVGDVDTFVQRIEEPIYKATLESITGLTIINTDNTGETVTGGTQIYLFYSYIKNKSGKFVQFIIRDDNREYTIDNKNVITDTNFRIQNELTYQNDGFYFGNNRIIAIGEAEVKYQANRLAYNQLTTYDTVTERTVEKFRIGDGDREVYKYTDYEYATSNVLTNYITNGENFNILEDGTLQGWSPYVEPVEGQTINKLELITVPELKTGAELADISILSQIEGYMKVHFNGALTQQYQNAIYNSGIGNNAAFIKSFSKGQKYVFRWRAGQGELNNLQPVQNLRLLVAKYTQDDYNRWDYYYKHIDRNNIILQFSGNPVELNNIIEGGVLDTEKKNYIIDDVVQNPSTRYIYKNEDDGLEYVWNGKTGEFDKKTSTNYLPYYYLVAEATKSISNTIISEPNEKVGIFIYNTEGERTYYIQDIQLTKFVPDGADPTGNTPILIGNIPEATVTSTDYYYVKPKEGAVLEDIETYSSLDDLASVLNVPSNTIVPLYNENSEKYLTISASQSNCFNILQTIAETFECWVDLVVGHDPDTGYITYDNDGKPNKFVYLREYVGKENWAGFKYGINLQSIERNINSDEFVTKLIVDQSQSDYVDEGYVSIASAPSNISGESYILNFDYYYNQNLLNREETEADKLNFITKVANINSQLKEKESERRGLEASLVELGSKRNLFTELIRVAQDKKNESEADFYNYTKKTYEEYRQEHTSLEEDKQLTEEETIFEILGSIYISSATINNYSGLLSNIEKEYWKVRKDLRGSENYTAKIWANYDSHQRRHVYIELNDYLPGFTITIGEVEEEATVNKKYFDIESTETVINFTAPQGYTINNPQYTITGTKIGYVKINNVNSSTGVEDEIEALLEEKEALVKEFNNKYSRYIQEGTWSSTDYIDSELYYLDALQVSNTSAQPVVSYTIDVVEVSRLENLEWYTFDAGDKSYIEDTEFFGWHKDNVGTEENPIYVYSPAREEVIVSEVEWHLDEPDKNVITVQNYKSRFEDLFQRISATVQTVQYNEATYAKTSSLIDANGTINQNVLLESLNTVSGKPYNLTSDGSVQIKGDSILIQNLNKPANSVIINSEGIRVSSDGGANYTTVVDGQGLNIGMAYVGDLNTNNIIIGDKENPSFRWDKSGISAYRMRTVPINRAETREVYDLDTYVRFDQYGLYGIKENETFKAQNLQDVIDKAHFAVTWNGFFIKNSYTGGGKVEITSENDFRVLKAGGIEKVKIGALEWTQGGVVTTTPIPEVAPSKYGIRIKNDAGAIVMQTGDDGNLEITGTIYANAGEIGGMTVDDDKLTMNTIVLEPGVGIYSTVKTNNKPLFIISDVDGSAIFRNIEALGGKLSNLSITDNLIVGEANAAGLVKSYNYVPQVSGWRIKSDGTAEFNDVTARGTIYANAGELGRLSVIDTITVGANGAIQSSNWNQALQTGWQITDTGATFNNVTVRGHVEAQTGTLGLLTVQDTITVGDATHSGTIQSYNYATGVSGWAIKSDGSAEFQNAVVRGEVNAGSGTFYGQVQVGTGNPHILIDGLQALIKSSNYSEGAGYGWMINKDGDAVFNNITARGAIKTAVFEYAEIQAVGGIFIFRPSSTIRSAAVVGDDLVLKVEKPFLFAKITYDEIENPSSDLNPHDQEWYEISQDSFTYVLTNDTEVDISKTYYERSVIGHSWCKISNYTSDGREPNISSILATNGLTHVYEVGAVNLSTKEVTLLGAKAFVDAVKQSGETNADVLLALEGGALVDMGRELNNLDYDEGKHNYGIGVNSSDNTVNLPARAISLFETVIDQTKSPKVSYNYKGILGTLPTLSVDHVNDSIYNQRMAGTQGIFTNNMYIGDASQFIAFYKDSNGNNQLRIKANQIVFEVTDEHGQGTGVYHDINEIEAEGVPGPPGEDAIQVNIESNIGNFLVFGNRTAILTCHVFKGSTEITSQVQTFAWSKYDKDGNLINNWQPEAQGVIDGLLVNQIRVSADDIDIKSVFSCNVTF